MIGVDGFGQQNSERAPSIAVPWCAQLYNPILLSIGGDRRVSDELATLLIR